MLENAIEKAEDGKEEASIEKIVVVNKPTEDNVSISIALNEDKKSLKLDECLPNGLGVEKRTVNGKNFSNSIRFLCKMSVFMP